MEFIGISWADVMGINLILHVSLFGSMSQKHYLLVYLMLFSLNKYIFFIFFYVCVYVCV